ncbi:hypothetical protein YERSI8AC_60002 [Enterobacterales bacterium 8AC]|nr:hypothetical protein YERSI8AC_60002 [Enterobacterales bacterium 8AC]
MGIFAQNGMTAVVIQSFYLPEMQSLWTPILAREQLFGFPGKTSPHCVAVLPEK